MKLPRWLLIGFVTLILGLMAIGIIEKIIGGFDYHGPSYP